MSLYVLVSADFVPWGGMDRANYELAWHLADRRGASVHLVGYAVAPALAAHPGVVWHRVPRPLNSDTLGGPFLAAAGQRIAGLLSRRGARVVVNGGNCVWPDVCWVHAVHAAWPNRDTHAPLAFRLRNAWFKYTARRTESRSLRQARLVLANSQRTRQQVLCNLEIPPERVHVVYLGVDPEVFRPFSSAEQAAARQQLGCAPTRPLVAFIGALGYDRNKGFDVLFDAWRMLCADGDWDADLIAAGRGSEVELWRHRAAELTRAGRIRILGFSQQIPRMLAAADVLVSPTHYDAYGLSVHEALCCGLPAYVTRCAGVAERYPEELADLLLSDPPGALELAARLRAWRRERDRYRVRVAPLSATLRRRTWAEMAAQISRLIEESANPPCGALS